jgi:hypothetical protein
MERKLVDQLKKVNEHQTEELLTVELITDDDTGMYSSDEFDFGLQAGLMDRCKKDPEFKKRVAKFVRELADNIENTEGFV